MKISEIGKMNSYMVKNTLGSSKKESISPLKTVANDNIGATPLKPLKQDVFIKTNEEDIKK